MKYIFANIGSLIHGSSLYHKHFNRSASWSHFASFVLTLALFICISMSVAGLAHAEEINFIANLEDGGSTSKLLSATTTTLGNFKIDTDANTVSYDFTNLQTSENAVAFIHGFAPRGWNADIIAKIPIGSDKKGVWNYPENQESNILAGLTYVDFPSSNFAGKSEVRGQIMRAEQPLAVFPAEMGAVVMAGTCHTGLAPSDSGEITLADMEPAAVQIIRGIPGDLDNDGKREVPLKVEIRSGGGYLPGLGHIKVELLQDKNPGLVKAQNSESDFPADMSLNLRKRYITPVGNFIGETERYLAKGITQFPPYGANLYPITKEVKLVDEKTGKHIMNLYPGTIVPLFGLDSLESGKNLTNLTVPKPRYDFPKFPSDPNFSSDIKALENSDKL